MLKGKVALITGATSGMGLAQMKKLVSQGAAVVFNGYPWKDSIKSIQETLKQKYEADTYYHPAEMKNPVAIEQMVEESVKKYSKIDILINNAGICFQSSPVWEKKPSEFEETIKVNLIGPFLMCKYVVPLMIKNKWGRIINISSIAGKVALPNGSDYCASKHGLIGLTKSLALEVAEHNITVNAICPGLVETPIYEKAFKDEAIRKQLIDGFLSLVPKKTWIKPDEVAEISYFLCGESAKNITGGSYVIDGGFIVQ